MRSEMLRAAVMLSIANLLPFGFCADWNQQQMITIPSSTDFGGGLSASGNTFVVIGDPGRTLYIYSRAALGVPWKVQQTIKSRTDMPITGGVLDGTLLVFGSIQYLPSKAIPKVHIFERSSIGHWAELQTLEFEDLYTGFSLSGNLLSVGHAQLGKPYNSGQPTLPGAVDIYARGTDGLFYKEATLKASDASVADYFGVSTSVHGDAVAVEALQPSATSSGAVYVFRKVEGQWIEEVKLPKTSPLPNATGEPVLYKDWLAFRGLSADRTVPGISVYHRDATDWNLVSTIGPTDRTRQVGISNKLSLDDTRLVVGTYLARTSGNVASGAVEVYELASLKAAPDVVFPNTPQDEEKFGGEVALISGGVLISSRFRKEKAPQPSQGAIFYFGSAKRLTSPKQ